MLVVWSYQPAILDAVTIFAQASIHLTVAGVLSYIDKIHSIG